MATKTKKNVGGRPSIYRPKDPAMRVHGLLTTEAGSMFEEMREKLAKSHDIKNVSDGDVVEWFVRRLWYRKIH